MRESRIRVKDFRNSLTALWGGKSLSLTITGAYSRDKKAMKMTRQSMTELRDFLDVCLKEG